MSNLDRLSLDDLSEMVILLTTLEQVGGVLISAGFTPAFHLKPSGSVGLSIDATMPAAGINELAEPGIIPVRRADLQWVPRPSNLWSEDTEPTPSPPAAAADDAPLAVGATTAGGVAPGAEIALPATSAAVAGDLTEAAPEQTAAIPAGEAGPVSGGGEDGVAAPSPAADLSQDVKVSAVPPSWTTEEEDRLIALVIAGQNTGITRSKAIAAAALDLDRPFEGTKSRFYNNLKDRFMAAEAASLPKAEAVPPQGHVEIAPKPAPAPGPATSDLTYDERALHIHLRAIGNKPPFDLETDIAIVEGLAQGARAHEVALDLGLDAAAVINRFKTLSEPMRDRDNRLPVEALTRLARVLAHMRQAA